MLFEKKKKLELKIDGMKCEHCVAKVKSLIKQLGGLADIDLKLGLANITIPEKIDTELVIESIKKLGFDCKLR